MDKRDPRFKSIKRSTRKVYSDLRKKGVSAHVKHAPTITTEEEKLLKDKMILDVDTPKGLLKKICCLKGGEDRRSLKPSQFFRLKTSPSYHYIKNGSKNKSGALQAENKEVVIQAVPENVPQHLIYLFHLFLSKVPEYAILKDVFYLHPKSTASLNPEGKWYHSVLVGKNKLSNMVKEMSIEAGFSELKTNYSLRATGATVLFSAGVI
uniref:ZMYM2-like/QRICH1 C-terminal domain-containing protein n=1 Tax=Amphimedon queenslandica TaxID=400682 RepID=A0A1X7VE92_AMPQE